HLCVVKGNYTPDSEKNRSYMLEFSPQLTFKNTSRRVDIDTLTLMPDYMADRVEKYNRLRSEGLKGDELAKAMGFASRGSLSVWAKKYIKNPQPDSPTNPDPKNLKDPKDPKAPNNPKDSNALTNSQPSPDLKGPNNPKDSNALSDSQPSDSQSSNSQPSLDLKDPKLPKNPKASNDSNALTDSEPSDSEPSDSPSIISTYPRRPRYNLVDILYPE
ncbi:MAG: hypothetical protein IKH26_01455, partial [Bacteroidaceae bacterium]|nr:hypothetical protein [Bacteroidaceae bacterium]